MVIAPIPTPTHPKKFLKKYKNYQKVEKNCFSYIASFKLMDFRVDNSILIVENLKLNRGWTYCEKTDTDKALV